MIVIQQLSPGIAQIFSLPRKAYIFTFPALKAQPSQHTLTPPLPFHLDSYPQGTMTLEEIQAMTPADIEALLESHTQLERQNRILMRQLEKAGITVAEDIPYDFAKEKVLTA
jgi:hypothetical protein